MKTIYKSRIDKIIIILFIAIIAFSVVTLALSFSPTWTVVIDALITTAVAWLMIDMLMHTAYTIHDDKLVIRCSIIYRITIPINEITSITLKSTILSSPALSLKRIGLRYGKYRRVHISPENQDAFIAELLSINPQITIK